MEKYIRISKIVRKIFGRWRMKKICFLFFCEHRFRCRASICRTGPWASTSMFTSATSMTGTWMFGYRTCVADSHNFDADTDTEPRFQIKAPNLEKVLKSYSNSFWLVICKLTRIRIQLITLMRIRIQRIFQLYADPDTQIGGYGISSQLHQVCIRVLVTYRIVHTASLIFMFPMIFLLFWLITPPPSKQNIFWFTAPSRGLK